MSSAADGAAALRVIVVGGPWAGVITAGVAHACSAQWLVTAPALAAPVPGLVLPSRDPWPPMPIDTAARLAAFAAFADALAPGASVQVPLVVHPPAPLLQIGIVDIGMLDTALRRQLRAQLIMQLGCTPQLDWVEEAQHSARVRGVICGDARYEADEVVLATGLDLAPHWLLGTPAQAEAVAFQDEEGLVVIRYPFQGETYQWGGEAAQARTAGIGPDAFDQCLAERIAPGLIQITLIGAGGLLDLPTLAPQVRTLLGLDLAAQTETGAVPSAP